MDVVVAAMAMATHGEMRSPQRIMLSLSFFNYISYIHRYGKTNGNFSFFANMSVAPWNGQKCPLTAKSTLTKCCTSDTWALQRLSWRKLNTHEGAFVCVCGGGEFLMTFYLSMPADINDFLTSTSERLSRLIFEIHVIVIGTLLGNEA